MEREMSSEAKTDDCQDAGTLQQESDRPSRACDHCRARKIRCDKKIPCYNCVATRRTCSSVGAGKGAKEQRQRVLISVQYEKKIDSINDRLTGIERLLSALTVNSGQLTSMGTKTESTSKPPPSSFELALSHLSRTPSLPDQPSDDETELEGSSSIAVQTVFASEFALSKTGLTHSDSNLEAALSSLQQIASMRNSQSPAHEAGFAHKVPLPANGIRGLPMVPWADVLEMLRELNELSPTLFTFLLCFSTIENFSNYCRQVYYDVDGYSDAMFIIVNAGLYFCLCDKQVCAKDPEELEGLDAQIQMCRSNLETALANMNLFSPAKIEYLHALVLGTVYAIDITKPSLAWRLNSAAVNLCLTMGLHISTGKKDNPELRDRKLSLFWFTYLHDRALSLRLGRSPIMRDADISIPKWIPFAHGSALWAEIIAQWLEFAQIQGDVYDELYSTQAMARPQIERMVAARQLADRVHRHGRVNHAICWRARASIHEVGMTIEEFDNMMQSDNVGLLATLTLVYRAIPPEVGTFSSECISMAKAAMQAHSECMGPSESNLLLKRLHMHWTIFFAPFIPFIVIFCHAIETLDTADLHYLVEFISSLEPLIHLSESVQKLHQLTTVLYNVALLHIKAKNEQEGTESMDISNEFDACLSSMGLIPGDELFPPRLDSDGNYDDGPAQNARLAGWYSGNRNMMDLLEQDWRVLDHVPNKVPRAPS